MMPSSEERWRNGSEAAQGALGTLLERINNDFTPQHDSQHFQPGFVPSASPPWTPGQAPLTSLSSQMPPMQAQHTNLGTQVPSMQSPHAGIGPQMSPLPPPTTSASCGMPLGAQLNSTSAARSYSASQDLFSELGGRSPLLRSSSDLGLRVNHFQAQGAFGDGRMDGFMDANMDPIDVMLVESHESGFFPEVQCGPAGPSGTPPPLQPDAQNMQPGAVPQPEFSFYSSGRDRTMEEVSMNNITAKLSNFTASLGSWFGPFDPFRSNFAADQTKVPEASQPPSPPPARVSPVNSEAPIPAQSSKKNSPVTSQPAKINKPSYSDVLSKNTGVAGSNSRSSSNSSSSSNNLINYPAQSQSPGPANYPPHSSSPGPASTRPDHQNHNHQGGSKGKPRNSNSGSSGGMSSGVGHNSKHHAKAEGQVSRVGMDEFDLNECVLSNGRITAYEHYDWGERIDISLMSANNSTSTHKATASSPTHQAKKSTSKGEKKCTPEKTNTAASDPESTRCNDQLNNRVNSNQQKQPPRRPSYINNNLNASSSVPLSASASGNQESKSTPRTSSSCDLGTFANNNNDITKSDGNKGKSTQTSKEERRNFEHSSSGNASTSRSSGRKQESRCSEKFERNKESQSKRGAQRKRKGTALTQSELVVAGWAVVVQWVGLAMQAVMWLGTLATDVVVMSWRLGLHLLSVGWARFIETWIAIKHNMRFYWSKWTTTYWNSKKEEKKMSGREKRISRGLECNISLPTTGDEAMKRLLACKGKDPYSILGVTEDCTDEDIKKYYKRQAFLVHPDKNKQPGAEEAFKILAHAFEIIGEPERRRTYDASLAEEVQLEGAWGELASLLTRLQEKLDEAANTIRCTNCNKRHRRTKLPKPIYAARHCAECQIHHAAREGDIWAESSLLGLRWRYYACMEGAVYDISEWAACQSENLKHLQANTHSVQYRIVSGKKNPPTKRNTPEFPSDPDLEEFFNNLCKEKFGKNYASGGGQSGGQQMPDVRKRKGKKKK